MIDFLRPWVFIALPLPVVAWWLLPAAAPAARMRATESVLTLMRAMQGSETRRIQSVLPLILLGAGWIALLLALAGPVTSLGNLIRPSGHDIVIAMDLSASMGQQDENRRATAFDQFKQTVSNFLEQVSPADRVALIAFGEQAYLIAPLTHDAAALEGYLEELSVGMPGRKTSVGVAVGLALKTFDDRGTGQKTLLVLSDGEDNAGDLPALDAALLARERGVIIHAVGFGGAEGGDGNLVLRQIAETTEGTFSTLDAAASTLLPSEASGSGSERPSTLPLKRLWSSELVLLAALLFAVVTFVRARRQ